MIVDKSDAIEAYRKLVQSTKKTIIDITERMSKDKNKQTVVNNGKENKLQNLNEQDVKRIIAGYQNVCISGDLHANAYIASEAKKLGIEKNELQSFILEKGKTSINSPNKVLHYHRTSMESFEKIMQTGFLLNRKNMQLNGIDISSLSGSSSANVQFTKDVYDENGKLQVSGFGKDNVGANSTDVVFVMGKELINEETYNCFMTYPTVEKADIQKCCVTILAKDPTIQMQIESILKERNMSIATMLQEDFNREKILEQMVKEEKTGFVLKSINGKDILSSAIEATEITTRESTISQQYKEIMQKERNEVEKLI